jgi:hypothetical protein
MAATKYYPSLSSVFNFDDLPESLEFLKCAGYSVLDKILLKQKDIASNSTGDSYSILLTMVVYNNLRFEIPGTGLALIMNPPQYEVAPGVSEFTVSIDVKYPLLRYLGRKKIANLLLDPAELFELALSLLGVSIEDLFLRAVKLYSYDGLAQYLVDRINTYYSLSTPITPVTSSTLSLNDIADILGEVADNAQLQSQDITVYDILFDLFVTDSSVGLGGNSNLDTLFYPWSGGSIIGIIKKLIFPQIAASLHLGLALEVPRSVLVPLDTSTLEPLPVNNPSNPPKTHLLFAQGDFTFSTGEGFGFDSEIALTLNPQYSRIGNTPLIISFQQAKLDLSRTKNIAEADADGRANDFVGVFIREASIGFPQFWNKDSGSTAQIVGRNLIIFRQIVAGKPAAQHQRRCPLPPRRPQQHR